MSLPPPRPTKRTSTKGNVVLATTPPISRFVDVANDMALARILVLNTSVVPTHVSGPTPNEKKATYAHIPTTINQPKLSNRQATAMTTRNTNNPAVEIKSNGRLPAWSTYSVATIQNTVLLAPTRIVIPNAAFLVTNPAFPKKIGE